MKNVIALLIILTGFSMSLSAKGGETDTLIFKVSGNCGMCKETIEEAVDVKGVKFAEWNEETGMITVIYQPDKINEEKIHQLIAKSGYDTEKVKADDEAYKDLPKCCQYKR